MKNDTKDGQQANGEEARAGCIELLLFWEGRYFCLGYGFTINYSSIEWVTAMLRFLENSVTFLSMRCRFPETDDAKRI